MNKLKVYKFIVNMKKKMTPSLETGCRVWGVKLLHIDFLGKVIENMGVELLG